MLQKIGFFRSVIDKKVIFLASYQHFLYIFSKNPSFT